MNFFKKSIIFFSFLFLYSCADYKNSKKIETQPEKIYFSSKGFALIYEDTLFKNKTINKKINNNDEIMVMHNLLKKNTPVKITNPLNSKVIETKIYKMAKYPSIFNLVISKKAAEFLEIDIVNPYVEVIEIKKNKTFVAKKSNTFDEEKNVAEKVPVKEIKMDVLSESQSSKIENTKKMDAYLLVISDFFYYDSANNLRNELIKKTKINDFKVKKTNNRYRLYIGPFKNFNALKNIYISLNNLGFEGLNVYKE